MRMFQSSSRHRSEQSTSHNTPRPAASQLKGVSDTILSWFENHRPQRTQISTVTNAPFRSKLEWNGLQVDRNRKLSERIFQLLQYMDSRKHPRFRLTGLIWWQKLTRLFQHFLLRIVLFVDFFLRCKFSFHEKRHSSQVWQWRDLSKPITILCQRIATNGIASFCVDHRWHQMAFFLFVKMGKAPLSNALREIKQLLCEQTLFLYYIKQIDSMLRCICPVIDHRERQNVVRTSVTQSGIASCAIFSFLPHFDAICDLLLDNTATWNLFVNWNSP